MNKNLKIISLGVLLSIASFGILLLLYFYVFTKLEDLTFLITKKYIVFNSSLIDQGLIGLSPLIIALIHVIASDKEIKPYFRNVFWVYLSIITMILFGFIVAILTWTNDGDPFIPEYYKYQPFKYYWTLFIFWGLIVSISYFYKLKTIMISIKYRLKKITKYCVQ